MRFGFRIPRSRTFSGAAQQQDCTIIPPGSARRCAPASVSSP